MAGGWRYGVIAGCLGLAACAVRPAPPPGSIPLGDDVYMAPAGADETGCPRYTAWSATQAVLAVIQYRRADGSFTALRDEADCPSAN